MPSSGCSSSLESSSWHRSTCSGRSLLRLTPRPQYGPSADCDASSESERSTRIGSSTIEAFGEVATTSDVLADTLAGFKNSVIRALFAGRFFLGPDALRARTPGADV